MGPDWEQNLVAKPAAANVALISLWWEIQPTATFCLEWHLTGPNETLSLGRFENRENKDRLQRGRNEEQRRYREPWKLLAGKD